MKRLFYISTSFIVLIILSFDNNNHHPWTDVETCLKNPDKYDGQIVDKFSEPKIGQIFANGFVLNQKHGISIKVFADTSGLITGKYIGLRARFHKEGYINAVELKVSKNRRYKIWLSVIPVFFVLFLLIRNLKFNWKKFYFELKNNA